MPQISYVVFCEPSGTIQGTVEVHEFEDILKDIFQDRDINGLDVCEPVYFTGSRWHLTDQKPSLAMVASWDYFLMKWGWNK